MILKLSEKAASVLAEKNSLDPDDTALMQYGLFIILSHILYAIICIICSAVFGVITQGVIFYLAFSFLRSYAGGYHASTEARCIAFSSAAILICVYCMSLCERFDLRIPFAVSAAAASIALLVFAPVDCREKPLSQKEKREYRKKSIALWLVYIIAVAVSAAADTDNRKIRSRVLDLGPVDRAVPRGDVNALRNLLARRNRVGISGIDTLDR